DHRRPARHCLHRLPSDHPPCREHPPGRTGRRQPGQHHLRRPQHTRELSMSLEPASRALRRRLPPRRGRNTQAGVGLLEVMISVLILGIGLLGIAAMQATALRNGQSSLERTQAVIQTYAVLDLLRANRTNAIAGYYNTGGAMRCNAAEAVDASLPSG